MLNTPNDKSAVASTALPQGNPPELKHSFLRKLLKVIAVLFLILFLVVLSGYVYLRVKFSDDNIRQILVTQLNRRSTAIISIDGVVTDWLGQKVDVSGIRIADKESLTQPFLEISGFSLKLDILQSIKEKTVFGDLAVQDLKLDVRRYQIVDKTTRQERYTTNITDTLNNLIDLPWKEWLGRIDWRRAGGSINFSNAKVSISDELKLLEKCEFSDINISLRRISDNIYSVLTLRSLTSSDIQGTVAFDLKAILNSPGKFNKNPRFGFLKRITGTASMQNIDVAQYLAYFGVTQLAAGKVALSLKDPLTLTAKVDSQQMDDVGVTAKLSTRTLGRLLLDNEQLGKTPGLNVELEGRLDLSQVWTEIKPLRVKLDLTTDAGAVLTASSRVNGNFGKEIVATVDAMSNMSLFNSSEIGRKLALNIQGRINHSLALNWKRDGIWKGNYTISGEGVESTIKGEKVVLPVAGRIGCVITRSKLLTPLTGRLDFSLDLPFLQLETNRPLELDFVSPSHLLTSAVTVKFDADLEKLYATFAGLLAPFAIGRISEKVRGTLAADNRGGIVCRFDSVSKLPAFKDTPLSVYAEIKPAGSNKHDFAFKAAAGGIHRLNLDGSVEKKPQYLAVKLAQNGVFDSAMLQRIVERFRSVVGEFTIPVGLSAALNEAINANINFVSADNYTVAASVKGDISDAKVKIQDSIVQRDSINLESTLVLRRHQEEMLLTLTELQCRTPDSFLKLGAGEYNLSPIFTETWRKSLSKLPALSGELALAQRDMEIIGSLTGNAIAELYFTAASLSGKFVSAGGGKARINDLKYKSLPLNVESKQEFSIDPLLMADKIIEHKWFEIQQSLSDVSATVEADLYNWRSFLPKYVVSLLGRFRFTADYFQNNDKLVVHSFSEIQGERKNLLLSNLVFTGAVNNFFKNIAAFDLVKFLKSVDKNLRVVSADISVARIKLLAGDRPGSLLRSLRGRSIQIAELMVRHEPGTALIDLSGSVAGKMSFMSKSSKWPLLELSGKVANYKRPFRFFLDSGRIESTGSIDLTDSAVTFNALSPYHYSKGQGKPLKIDYTSGKYTAGAVSLKSASLVGGPLAVELSGFEFKPIRDRYRLSLESAKLDGDFTAVMTELLLDSAGDKIKADIEIAPFNLASIQQNLRLNFPLNISGSVDGITLHIDDGYWKYFAPVGVTVNTARMPNNIASVGRTDVTIASAVSPAESLTFGFSRGAADVSLDSINLFDVTVSNPAGFSDNMAVDAGEVRIQPDFQTLFSDQIIINRIDVDKLNAYYEVALLKNNFDELKRNIAGIFSGGKVGSGHGTSRKTLIRDLYVNDGVVRLSSKLVLGLASIPVPLNLHLQNIGGDTPGETLAFGIGDIFTSIGKIGVTLVSNVGGVISGVGRVGKSIITAPLKLFKKAEDEIDKE